MRSPGQGRDTWLTGPVQAPPLVSGLSPQYGAKSIGGRALPGTVTCPRTTPVTLVDGLALFRTGAMTKVVGAVLRIDPPRWKRPVVRGRELVRRVHRIGRPV